MSRKPRVSPIPCLLFAGVLFHLGATTVRAQPDCACGPDLVPTVLAVPAAAKAGGALPFIAEIKNRHLFPAGRSTSALLVTYKASQYTSGDLLVRVWSTPALIASQSQRVTGVSVLPRNAYHGARYITVAADYRNQVNEPGAERNNRLSKPISISGFPDLTWRPLQTTMPTYIIRGQLVRAIGTMSNLGYIASGRFRTGLYLSTDSKITPQDTFLGGRTIGSLESRQHDPISVSGTAPTNLPLGDCYIGLWVDDQDAVYEGSETNNVVVKKIKCLDAVRITKQPAARNLAFGWLAPGTAVMSVVAENATSYQWYRYSVKLPGKTGPALTLSTDIKASDAGHYHCIVSNAYMTVRSNQARVTVGPARAFRVETGASDLVANVGDVDGDGYEDWARGRPFHTTSSSGIYLTSGKTQQGLGDARFGGAIQAGTSIAAGDLDGDGKSDVLFGAPAYRVGGLARGQIWYRSSRQNRYYVFVNGTSLGLGTLVATAQLDADGVSDVVAVDNSQRDLRAYSGKTRRVLWNVRPFSNSQNVRIRALARVGDTNADGYDDLVIGLPTYGSGNGRWELRSGRDGALLRSYNGAAAEQMGFAVAGIGDVTGDGVPDLVAGAPAWGSFRGRAMTFSGATGALHSYRWGISSGYRGGYAVASAGGDVNGDGVPDVLFSAVPTSSSRKGIVRVVSGKSIGKLLQTRIGASASYGTSLAGFDANGDSKPDVLVLERRKNVYLYDGIPKADPPRVTVYGRTCPGTGGRLPRIGTSGPLPRVGGKMTVTLGSGRARSVAILNLGALPRLNIPLDAAGMTGCSLLGGAPITSFTIPTDARGAARQQVPIASSASLTGARVTWQWFPYDIGANGFNLTASSGAEMRIGAK